MNWPDQLVWIGAGAAAVMLALWLLQLRTRDAGVVDVGWAACLGAAAVFCALTGPGDPARRAIIGAMGGIWGARLAVHLLTDRVLTGPEDGRYQMMRQAFGTRIQPVFLVFFLAQALLVVILAVPFVLASLDARPGPALLDFAALAVWIIGLLGEGIADRQLAAFKANASNRGAVCQAGLWRFSRHPNYFFEWLMWIGYALAASGAVIHAAHTASTGSDPLNALAPHSTAPLTAGAMKEAASEGVWVGWIAWTAPALILLFVLKLTGIPPTEARALRSRGDAYRRYQRTTSPFLPWWPKPDPTPDVPASQHAAPAQGRAERGAP